MSNAVVTCQHKLKETHTEESSGGTWQDYSITVECGKPVFAYRTCGAGAAVKCKKLIAYCSEHGGDPRSQEEMREHHKEHAP